MTVLQPRLVRGATTLNLTEPNGYVLTIPEEEERYDVELGGRLTRAGGVFDRARWSNTDFTQRGLVRGTSIADARSKIASLWNILGEGAASSPLFFAQHDDRACTVTVVDRSKEWIEAEQFFACFFSFGLANVDPYWFNPLVAPTVTTQTSSTGSANFNINNTGDAPCPFLLEIRPNSGSLADVTVRLVNTTIGQELRVGKITISAGKILRINTETGLVTDDTGQVGVSGALAEYVDGFFFRLVPSSNALTLFVNGTAGSDNVRIDITNTPRFWSL